MKWEYAYDAASQLTGVTYKFGTTTLGNLTYGCDGARTYTWDARDRLTALAGAATASFQYDAFGRRTSKAVSGTTTGFLYDGANAVQELTGGTPAPTCSPAGWTRCSTHRRGGHAGAAAGRVGVDAGAGGRRGGGADAAHVRAVRGDDHERGGQDQPQPVHRPGERRHGALLLPGAVLQSHYAAVHQRGPARVRRHDVNLYAYVWDSPTNVTDPRGTKTQYSNDVAGRLTRREVWQGCCTILSKVEWTYNANGDVTGTTVYTGYWSCVNDDGILPDIWR